VLDPHLREDGGSTCGGRGKEILSSWKERGGMVIEEERLKKKERALCFLTLFRKKTDECQKDRKPREKGAGRYFSGKDIYAALNLHWNRKKNGPQE